MRRSGFTLIEMMIVVVIIGLVSLIAFPKARAMVVGADVRSAHSRVVTMFNQARLAAQQANKSAVLKIEGNTIWVERPTLYSAKVGVGCGCDTVGPVQDLWALHSVSVSATTNTIPVRPNGVGGLVGGEDVVIRFVRGSVRDSVVISPFGKVK